MNPKRTNPFRATFGATPPLLVGRSDAIRDFGFALDEGPGAHERISLIIGPRGIGKTVLLNAFEDEAVKRGWLTGATLRSRSVVDKAGIVAAAERAVWPLVAAGRIDASVGACFPLAEAAEAFDWFDSATRTGKVVLVTDPADARRPSGDRA